MTQRMLTDTDPVDALANIVNRNPDGTGQLAQVLH